jgi:two-component system OmpR family response regulator
MLKVKILIVDDEMDYCVIMKSYFEEKNYEVFLAYTLREATEMLDIISPDILFLDNNLPDGKGWECVEEINKKFPLIKIYLISAYRQKPVFEEQPENLIIWEKPISLKMLETIF